MLFAEVLALTPFRLFGTVFATGAVAWFARFGLVEFAVGQLTQILDLLGFKFTELPGFEIEDEWTVADSANLLHVVADLLEHLAQFAIAPFNEHDFKPWVFRPA